ncbi:MAG: DUF3570 domain-containing protein [Myxococcota bacterium]
MQLVPLTGTLRLLVAWGAALAATTVPLGAPSNASAQGWSGAVEVRGNYYWERSTRVVAPEINVEAESPGGLRVNGHYLVDSITSASQAAGAIVDVRFTEIRHDFGAGIGYEFDLGDASLDLSANLRYSNEPDYRSHGARINAALALNDRATTLNLGVGGVHDVVGSVLRGTSEEDQGKVGNLNSLVVSAGISQVLTPTLQVSVGYDFGYLSGFLSNPYRAVPLVQLEPERHPDTRSRHTLYGRVAWYIPATRTALHALYRAYIDSWDIGALTPELRVYQELGDTFVLRTRWRHYTQTRAFFQQESYTEDDEFRTADPKMTRFHSNLLGGLLLVRMDFLEGSALDFARDATFELGIEYIWNTNSFGNGVIAQAGARVPF